MSFQINKIKIIIPNTSEGDDDIKKYYFSTKEKGEEVSKEFSFYQRALIQYQKPYDEYNN